MASAPVSMPELAGDGWDLDSGFDSDGDKQMPKVMVGDARNTEFACRAANCSFCASFTRKTFSLGDSTHFLTTQPQSFIETPKIICRHSLLTSCNNIFKRLWMMLPNGRR